jgi:hypothetical protein
MTQRIRELTLGAALLAAVTFAAPVRAVPAPDSAQRAALQSRIGHLGRVQIVGARGATLLLKPVVRDDGLHMREPYRAPRQALIEIGELPPPPPPVPFVPWSEISVVQAPVNGFKAGLVAGAVFAGVMAGAVIFSYRHVISREWDRYDGAVMVGTPLFMGAGALAGGLLFGLVGEQWRTVYPVRAARR